MKPTQNSPAIPFETTDIYNQKIQLDDFKSQKILLSFYRNVACPFCNLRVYQLSKLADTFKEKGMAMIFIFETPKRHILRSGFHSKMSPIPIIGDPDLVLYELYGIEKSKLKFNTSFLKQGFLSRMLEAKKLDVQLDTKEKENYTMPADFLIDENFNIVEAHYGQSVQDNIPMDKIKAFAGI